MTDSAPTVPVEALEPAYGGYPDLTAVERVLVVKMGHHGDVLLASPVFSTLRSALPRARIDAYINRESLPMLEGHPAISRFIMHDRSARSRGLARRLAEEARLVRELRSGRYDLAINLSAGDRGRVAAYLSGAPVRVGFETHTRRIAGYTHVAKRSSTPRHLVERNLDALRRVGVFPGPRDRDLALALPDAERSRVRAMLGAEGIEPGRFVHVHPASRWRFKTWPAERVAAVVNELRSWGIRCVLTGAPDPAERAMTARIAALASAARPLDLAGRLTLKELSAVIECASVLLCVDSVPLHMASALKRPVVALFGPSSDIDWGPWANPHARVVEAGFPCRPCGLDGCGGSKVSECLVQLPVPLVLSEIRSLLDATATLPHGPGTTDSAA